MLGKVIDINKTDAFITFIDGTTMDIGLSHLPPNVKLGDIVEVPTNTTKMVNEKLIDFF